MNWPTGLTLMVAIVCLTIILVHYLNMERDRKKPSVMQQFFGKLSPSQSPSVTPRSDS